MRASLKGTKTVATDNTPATTALRRGRQATWGSLAICVYLLVAILKKELELTQSLHEILQILSLHPFEQTPIKELLKTQSEIKPDENQKLFDFNRL